MSENYSQGFREALLQKMLGPAAKSLRTLAKESGVPQSTLSRWRHAASTLSSMSTDTQGKTPKSTRDWPAAQKLSLISEAASIPPLDLGAFLRSKGLLSTDLDAWRNQAIAALSDSQSERRRSEGAARRIKELERELDRKDRRLRASEALLDLQKKVREIWGDEGDPIPPKSGP